jgi:hypothetical protein
VRPQLHSPAPVPAEDARRCRRKLGHAATQRQRDLFVDLKKPPRAIAAIHAPSAVDLFWSSQRRIQRTNHVRNPLLLDAGACVSVFKVGLGDLEPLTASALDSAHPHAGSGRVASPGATMAWVRMPEEGFEPPTRGL